MKHIIDAKNKKLGRVATEAAVFLMGKDTPFFAKNIAPEIEVEVINASKLDISEKKKREKIYDTYSGYPGGLKHQTLGTMIVEKGAGEAIRKAIMGMLPKNKLRDVMLTHLTITE